MAHLLAEWLSALADITGQNTNPIMDEPDAALVPGLCTYILTVPHAPTNVATHKNSRWPPVATSKLAFFSCLALLQDLKFLIFTIQNEEMDPGILFVGMGGGSGASLPRNRGIQAAGELGLWVLYPQPLTSSPHSKQML